MNKKWFWIVLVVSFSMILVSLLLFLGTKKEPGEGKNFLPSQADTSATAGEMRMVKLFFLKDTSSQFFPVKREFKIPAVITQKYKTFIDMLIQGAEGYIVPAPDDLSLIQAYLISESGAVILDFQEDVLDHLPIGTDAEREFVYFFVNNLCVNFPEVKKVGFLFGGNQHQTLSGHMDMERAYLPDFTLLVND